MSEMLSLACLLALLVVSYDHARSLAPGRARARRLPEGFDFGTMPPDERDADWS